MKVLEWLHEASLIDVKMVYQVSSSVTITVTMITKYIMVTALHHHLLQLLLLLLVSEVTSSHSMTIKIQH